MTTAREAGRELLVSSLTGRAAQMREHERKCRGAYTTGPLFDACQRLAEVYRRAAELFERELAVFEFEEQLDPPALSRNDPRVRAKFGGPPAAPGEFVGGCGGPSGGAGGSSGEVYEPGDPRLRVEVGPEEFSRLQHFVAEADRKIQAGGDACIWCGQSRAEPAEHGLGRCYMKTRESQT